MTENAFTPVSIRRRSAAQVCADAHTDSVAPGDAVGSAESTMASVQDTGFHMCFQG